MNEFLTIKKFIYLFLSFSWIFTIRRNKNNNYMPVILIEYSKIWIYSYTTFLFYPNQI
jgi:hypothetical protein